MANRNALCYNIPTKGVACHDIPPCRPNDAEALVRLNAAFNEVDMAPEAVRHSLLTSPEIVILAEAAGDVVAFCCAQVHHSFCYPAPVAEVTEMYVDKAHRCQGCAAGMLRFLEEHLSTRYGVDELHLLTGTQNFPAQAAYKKAGFVIHHETYMAKEVLPTR